VFCFVVLWRFQCELQVPELCRSQQAVCVTFAPSLLLNFLPSFLSFDSVLIACCAACMVGRGNSGALRRYESLQFQEVSGE
jgi:hypothetical protein